MRLLELFCPVDDFWKAFAPSFYAQQISCKRIKRCRPGQLSSSEVMTMLIAFHQLNYRTFKAYYLEHVCVSWRDEFPG
jgi:hypothetical protein